MNTKTILLILVFFALLYRAVSANEITPALVKNLPPLPVKAVTELKKYENFNLATEKISISQNISDEVGYGVTNEEVEDAIKEGFLPYGSKLPAKMTKAEADTWLVKVTIPTYRSIVRKTVTVYLTIDQEAGLVFFTQNTGRGNLKKLVAQEDRLNDGNYQSVVNVMPLYYKEAKLKSRVDFQIAVYKGKSFAPKV